MKPWKEWDSTETDLLQKLVAERLSDQQIAAEMKKTRNSIIGKRERLKLPTLYRPALKPWNDKRREREKIRLARKREIKKMEAQSEQVKPLHTILMDLRYGQCRYPYGEKAPYTYCALPTDGHSWCDYHKIIVFNAPRTR